MKEYHKIQSLYKRDPENKFKTFLDEYSIPEFELLRDCQWIFTEKVDGTNIRIMYDYNCNLTIGGKTDKANIPADLTNYIHKKFTPKNVPIPAILEGWMDGICFYGEGYGKKIQKVGHMYSSTQEFVLFDIKVKDKWLERENVEDIGKAMGMRVVPIIGSGTLDGLEERCKEGFDSQWGDFEAEGIVARPKVELLTSNGHRIITKVKCKDLK
ncbi:MAG: hypothetical protein GY861_01835 [bacterium]|nr:hypothetical protein [bacterium]